MFPRRPAAGVATFMRALFTGAASPLGKGVLECLLADDRYTEVWCGLHERDVALASPKLRRFRLRLEGEVKLDEIPAPLDLVIHFAGVTHAPAAESYREVNLCGTKRLAEAARARGCRRFVYVSTRCATPGSGAYGESKLAAERELQKLDWESLLVLRPAEVYSAGGREGLDKFIELAERFHIAPLLFGHEGLRFSPLHGTDFIRAACSLVAEMGPGVKVLELCGPESLSGAAVAARLARRYRAVPVPLWWPALSLALRLLRRAGLNLVAPDQLQRLTAQKTATSSTPDPALKRPVIRFMNGGI